MTPTPITPEIIEQLKSQYSSQSLFQLDLPEGESFIIRGSCWDEFSRMGKAAKGNEQRLALDIVRTFVVHPVLDATDLEYNKSKNWEPGRIAALSEKIQETLGYSKEISVKKL